MALRLAILQLQALAASLSPAEPASPKPASGSGQGTAAANTSRRRLIASAAVLASSSQMLAPTAARGASAFDLRLTVPEQSGEDAEAVVKAHARNLLRVKRLIDAGAWRELQAELRASASNLKQDLYAIIQDSPASRRPELRRLYSNLFNSVTNLDYAAREKNERQVQEHYGNIVSALDEIFAKIT